MMTDKIRKADFAARLADHEGRIRHLETWASKPIVTGPPEDPFAGLSEEAAVAAALMLDLQEAYLSGDDPFAGPGPFELEEPEWQLEAVAARPVDLG